MAAAHGATGVARRSDLGAPLLCWGNGRERAMAGRCLPSPNGFGRDRPWSKLPLLRTCVFQET
eukprot:11190217-Lingulodinium_polyedra.AAC.1